MLARVAPHAPATVALSEVELQSLEKMVKEVGRPVRSKIRDLPGSATIWHAITMHHWAI
jgi:hypothetical protein